MATKAAEESQVSAVLDQVLNLLTDLTGRVQQIEGTLSERVGALEGAVQRQGMRQVKFQPMQPAQGISKPKPDLHLLQKAGQEISGGHTLPVASNGLRVPNYQPMYPEGALVKINPDTELGRRLTRAGYQLPQLEGEVVGFHYISRDWRMKYRVAFEGLTRARGDGFWEDELIPA